MLDVQIKKQLPRVLLNVNFQVKEEILVLFGPSGAGKTTILNMIAGLEHPDEGRIALNDQTFFIPQQKPCPTRKRKIGYLFQDYALFPHMTVEQNIYYGVHKTEVEKASATIGQLVNVLGIYHLLKKYPHQISGGEKQRVALARALATTPSALLLDEPLSALDRETRLQCQKELLRLHQLWKIPFIIVTHDLDEAKKLGNRILHLENGVLIEDE